jgi:hypothetical protein
MWFRLLRLRSASCVSPEEQSVSPRNPDCPTLVEMSNKANQQKIWPNEPGGRARLFCFVVYFFILFIIEFILLIEFNFVLTFLKDARERGALSRRLPESTARSGRATVYLGR